MTKAPTSTCHSLLFQPECEVFWEGGDGPAQKRNGCPKNPGHTAFIPVDTLTMEDLPEDYRTQEHLDWIRLDADRTVKINVKSTSQNRPDTWPGRDNPYPYAYLKGCDRAVRVGTGFIERAFNKYGRCLCHICKTTGGMEDVNYMEVTVHTATHVIFDEIEAVTAVFDCFYDSNDRKGVKLLYGIGMDKTDRRDELQRCRHDRCYVRCVTHDKELMRKMEDMTVRRLRLPYNLQGFSFIVSHPHGGSKKLSIGTVSHYSIEVNHKFPRCVPHAIVRLFDDDGCPRTVTCRLSSPSQPANHIRTTDVMSYRDQEFSVTDKGARCNMYSPISISGAEYYIPGATTFTLPQDADYLCRGRKDGKDEWVIFPPGTIFTLPDGRMLPPQTEFRAFDIDSVRPIATDRCVNYNIPTCPGSSGARVVVDRDDPLIPWYYMYGLPHSGACLHDGTNQSSYG